MEEADRKEAQLRSAEFLQSIQRRGTFAGRTYSDSRAVPDRTLKAMGDAIAETYLDGYQGRL